MFVFAIYVCGVCFWMNAHLVNSQLSSLHKAVTTLRDRVGVIQQFLKDVAQGVYMIWLGSELLNVDMGFIEFISCLCQGKIQADHRLLRAVKGLCNRLPAMDSPQFRQDFLSVCFFFFT